MNIIRRIVEVIVNLINRNKYLGEPTLLAHNINRFNKAGWVTRLKDQNRLGYYQFK